jgi:hypothetical protein
MFGLWMEGNKERIEKKRRESSGNILNFNIFHKLSSPSFPLKAVFGIYLLLIL